MEHQHSIQEPPSFCSNCHSHLANDAKFCAKCGQKNTNNRLNIKELLYDFFDNVFSLDSKIFRTLRALLIPGKLTNAFLNGQRKKYYQPIRLFLVLIVISLAGLNNKNNFSALANIEKEHIDKLTERKRLMDVFDNGIDSISENTDQRLVLETLDSLSNIFYRNSGRRADSINLNDAIKITDDFDFYIALEDFDKYSPKEILQVYEVKGFLRRLIIQQKMKMVNEGTSFIPFLMGKVSWVLFIVLFLHALIFKLLYFKRDFLYLEHLIFGVHLNSFFFIILSIFNLFPEEMMGKLLPWIILIMAVYFFIALKRVYQQSYFVTSLKFIVASVCYFFLGIFGFILTVVGSFFIF